MRSPSIRRKQFVPADVPTGVTVCSDGVTRVEVES